MLYKNLKFKPPCIDIYFFTLRYPFTNVGVGGVVQNKSGEILLMKERRGHYLGWKFPGGLSVCRALKVIFVKHPILRI